MKAKRHLHHSAWFLGGLVLLGGIIAILFVATDSSPKEKGGRWVLDSRGVWVSEGEPGIKPEPVREQEFLVHEAFLAYRVLVNAQKDLSAGPCLGNIFQGWIADIVHTPRQAIDDDPKNQCAQYRNGIAKHFIELSLTGDIVRIQ